MWLGGPFMLTKIVQSMKDYDLSSDEERSELYEKAYSQWLAYLYLENADRAKYGTILVGLNTQQSSLKNNQYPKSITEANNVLSHHRYELNQNKPPLKKADDNKSKGQDKSTKNDHFLKWKGTATAAPSQGTSLRRNGQ
jgi:hypothetical protein